MKQILPFEIVGSGGSRGRAVFSFPRASVICPIFLLFLADILVGLAIPRLIYGIV